jgi:hypothetical protein
VTVEGGPSRSGGRDVFGHVVTTIAHYGRTRRCGIRHRLVAALLTKTRRLVYHATKLAKAVSTAAAAAAAAA